MSATSATLEDFWPAYASFRTTVLAATMTRVRQEGPYSNMTRLIYTFARHLSDSLASQIGSFPATLYSEAKQPITLGELLRFAVESEFRFLCETLLEHQSGSGSTGSGNFNPDGMGGPRSQAIWNLSTPRVSCNGEERSRVGSPVEDSVHHKPSRPYGPENIIIIH